MKRKLTLTIMGIAMVALILALSICLWWVDARFLEVSRQHLHAMADLIEPREYDEIYRGEYTLPDGVRLTILKSDGRVTVDSLVDPATMESHADRPEVIEALRSGEGESVRVSDTTGILSIHYARRWGDLILRLTTPLADSRDFARNLIPVMLLAMGGAYLIVWLMTPGIIRHFILRPLSRLTSALEEAIRTGAQAVPIQAQHLEDDEFRPLVEHFNHLLTQLSLHIAEITHKNDDIREILSTMQEGLIFLDEHENVLVINRQALQFLGFSSLGEERNIAYLYRDDAFTGALASVMSERRAVALEAQQGERHYRLSISPSQLGGAAVLISDITDLVRLERMRSQFSANVSHELRTPMTSISGYAELLLMQPRISEAARGFAQKIFDESRRLNSLIDDILKLTTLENSALAESPVCDLASVFHEARTLLAPQAEKAQITVSVSGRASIRAQRTHMMEVAINLMENAIKYNRPGGNVTVTLSQDEDGAYAQVADTGIGIPVKHQGRVFERFYRVDKSRSKATGGTGLGLAIVKHILLVYGGTVRLTSTNSGSTFTLRFPKG